MATQVGTQMVLEDLGGIIFFTDPLTAHPHAEDIATLLRMADINNVMHATNPITAVALIPVLRALSEGAARHGHKRKGRLWAAGVAASPSPCGLETGPCSLSKACAHRRIVTHFTVSPGHNATAATPNPNLTRTLIRRDQAHPLVLPDAVLPAPD